MKKLLIAVTLLCLHFQFSAAIDPPKFKYGFGGGVNLSNISELQAYLLYEDVSGETYSSRYSTLFSNFGSQFFFHGEFLFNKIILALKPGVYTYSFGKTDEVIFNTETVEQHSSFLLRYINIPVEVKWMIGSGTFKPYIGGEGSFGYLMKESGSASNSFIKPRFSAGPVAGGYFSFSNFDLVASLGYDMGLHIITSKDNRFNTSIDTPFSQSDLILHNLNISLSILFSLEKSNLLKSLECPKPQRR